MAPRRCISAAQRALQVLIALVAFPMCGPGMARAEATFGDSTWVAPDASFDDDSTAYGPRVAKPDHERTWETVLRTPFRVAFFPMRVLGGGLELVAEIIGPRLYDPGPKVPKRGPRLGVSGRLGTGTDFGIGPAITWQGIPTADSKLTATATWSMADHRHVRFTQTIGTTRPVGFRLRVDYDRKPTKRYYGIGNETRPEDLGYFLLEGTNAEAALLIGSSPIRQLRVVAGYSAMSPRRGYNRTPLLEDVFPLSSVPGHTSTEEYLYGIGFDLGTLDDARDPSRGVHAKTELRRARGVGTADPDYKQWWLEGRAYVPVFAKRRVLAFRGVYTGIDPSGGDVIPFYRYALSGDNAHFAGYNADRFRDRRLMLARVEYRWAVIRRLSALALYEAGEVGSNSGKFSLRGLHKSYGVGARLGLTNKTAFRGELAKSVEGFRMVLALGSDW